MFVQDRFWKWRENVLNSLQPFEAEARLNMIFSPYLETQHVPISEVNWLMLFKEMIIIYTENHTKPINTLCGQN
jgi:hypothetical protein